MVASGSPNRSPRSPNSVARNGQNEIHLNQKNSFSPKRNHLEYSCDENVDTQISTSPDRSTTIPQRSPSAGSPSRREMEKPFPPPAIKSDSDSPKRSSSPQATKAKSPRHSPQVSPVPHRETPVATQERAQPTNKRSRSRSASPEHAPRRLKLEDRAVPIPSSSAEVVAAHYNARPQGSVEKRHESTIFQLRCFNNWIKAVLFQRYLRRGDAVMDIGVGKGGDLQKYRQAGIRKLVGLDVAANSINQARERYASLRNAPFEAEFHVLDCYNNLVHPILSPQIQFDVVSLQFCMHYAFVSEASVRIMLYNIARQLKLQGIFVGTCPSDKVLLDRLNALPASETSFSNPIYRVKFTDRPEKHPPVYGIEYTFHLQDAIDDCPEYVVKWNEFCRLAKSFGLYVIEHQGFHEFYHTHRRQYDVLLRRMRVLTPDQPSIGDNEWEAAGLYSAFAFQKREQVDLEALLPLSLKKS